MAKSNIFNESNCNVSKEFVFRDKTRIKIIKDNITSIGNFLGYPGPIDPEKINGPILKTIFGKSGIIALSMQLGYNNRVLYNKLAQGLLDKYKVMKLEAAMSTLDKLKQSDSGNTLYKDLSRNLEQLKGDIAKVQNKLYKLSREQEEFLSRSKETKVNTFSSYNNSMEKDLEVLMSYSGELVRWLNDTSDKLGSNTREMIGNVNSAIKNSNVFGGIGVVLSLQWRIQWNTFLDSWNAFFALLGSFKYIKNFFSNLKVKSLKTSFKNFERSVLAFNKEQDRREHTAELLVNQKETLKKFAIICQSTANEMKKAAISHVNNKIKKSIVAKKSNLLNETNAMESASENTKTKISICEFLIRLSTSIIDTYK